MSRVSLGYWAVVYVLGRAMSAILCRSVGGGCLTVGREVGRERREGWMGGKR